MFKTKKIKYFRIKFDENLFVKYVGEQEKFLTNGKVDLEDFKKKQFKFLEEKRKQIEQRAKNWEERHLNYLKFKNLNL